MAATLGYAVFLAFAAGSWWASTRVLRECDFWWLTVLAFVIGSSGPWLLPRLQRSWPFSMSKPSTPRSMFIVRKCERLATTPATSASPLRSDTMRQLRRATWDHEKHRCPAQRPSSSPSPSTAAGSSESEADPSSLRLVRKLVPDPERKGKWKYVDCPPEDLLEDGERTPRLGPPTPPVPPELQHALNFDLRGNPVSAARKKNIGVKVLPPPTLQPLPPVAASALLERRQKEGGHQCATPPLAGMGEVAKAAGNVAMEAEKVTRVKAQIRAFEATRPVAPPSSRREEEIPAVQPPRKPEAAGSSPAMQNRWPLNR